MTKLGFFSAVTYGNQPTTCSQKILEMADGYLHLGSTRYQVIDPKKGEVTLSPDAPRSYWTTALKVASYALFIPVLVALIAKVILRCVYSFTVMKQPEASQPQIELPKPVAGGAKVKSPVVSANIKPGDQAFRIAQAELRREIDLKGIPEKVVQAMKEENGIQKMNSSSCEVVFALPDLPGLIFKTDSINGWVESQFDSLVRAQYVIKRNKLDRIVLPQAAKFEAKIKGKSQVFIAQQRLDFNSNAAIQEDLSFVLSRDKEMRETVKQVTRFIIAMKCSKVSIFFLSKTDHRVAIVNAHPLHYDSFSNECINRLIGNLFSEELIVDVIGEAFGTEKIPQEIQQAKERQLEEIQKNQKLYEFYLERGIFDEPNKLIHIEDLSEFLGSERSLLSREAKEEIYRKVLETINQKVLGNSEFTYLSREQKRSMSIYPPVPNFSIVEDFLKYLIQEGLIFSYEKRTKHSIYIQA